MTETQKQAAAEWMEIEQLKPWKDNPRKNKRAVRQVAESIEQFGFGAPVLARVEDGMVIAGHTRILAAKYLGMDKVPVRLIDVTAKQARLMALADNKLSELAKWDDSKLGKVFRDLEDENTEIDEMIATGFEEDEIARLMEMDQDEGFDGVGADELPQAIQLKPAREYVVIMCDDDNGIEFEQLREVLDLQLVRRGGYKKGSPLESTGIQRVVQAATILEILKK